MEIFPNELTIIKHFSDYLIQNFSDIPKEYIDSINNVTYNQNIIPDLTHIIISNYEKYIEKFSLNYSTIYIFNKQACVLQMEHQPNSSPNPNTITIIKSAISNNLPTLELYINKSLYNYLM